jgi:hypothetical protein
MKYSILFLIPLTGIILSCNNESRKSSETITREDSSKPVDKTDMSNGVCYSRVTGQDTIFLQLEKVSNVVTGSLSIKIYEKDSNHGVIDGKLSGDTLLADYKFMSEGIQSTRQVIFLLKDSNATQGYGPMEERDGKIVFQDLKEVDFGHGTILQKITCPH